MIPADALHCSHGKANMTVRRTFAMAAILVGSILLTPSRGHGSDDQAAGPVLFESKIRPLLADNCFKCHGDAKQRGGLRLDSRATLLTGGDQGPAIVPGKPELSLLISAVNYDGDLKMPPTKKLSKEQIAHLTRWVRMGAPWPGDAQASAAARHEAFRITDKDRSHWAFQPIRRPPPPAVRNKAWVANPIDAFILAPLEAKGLQPSPPAPAHELGRRLYYNLTGLPPTLADIEALAGPSSATAYVELVDRLLASPHYGEKWGRHWLDLVRYAETNSYERDNPKPNAWRYRDYVIRSFNEDKPFDRFTREQLAGDELEDGGNDGLIATGYYRLGIWDDEPSDPLQSRYDGLDDIVATTAQVFLGLTVDCARCHDHKIDPIAQKDYYRLLAFFHNINHYRNGGPTDEVALLSNPEERLVYEQRVRELEHKRDEVQAQVTAIENEYRAKALMSEGDAVECADLDELEYRYYRDTWNRLPDFSLIKPEDAGKLSPPLFDLGRRTRNEAFGFVFEGVLIVPQTGSYTFYLDSDDGARLSIAGKNIIEYDGIHGLGKEQRATVDLVKGRLPIKLEYFQNLFSLGLNVAWSGPGFSRRSLSATEKTALAADVAKVIEKEGPRVLGTNRVKEYSELRKKLGRLKEQRVPVDRGLCITEAGNQAPDTYVLLRGNPHVKGEKVEPGFLEVLGAASPTITPPAGGKTTGRRTILANWIAATDNPLTARVIVNRVWQYHFGRGLVRSPNNFGTQGDKPTHQELLDWLAAEFIANGWRLKDLHRLILTSNTYRMSSRAHAEFAQADPMNDLFWRFDMRRLSAEEVRDSILSVTGVANYKMYGPGVYPAIPREVMAGQSRPGYGWGRSTKEEQNRRSVYVHVKRSLLLPILESFDAAETDRSSPVRFATTQPTQALGMLNGSFLNSQADTLVKRLQHEATGDVSRQVRLGLSLVMSRPPSEHEVRRGLDLVAALGEQDGLSEDEAMRLFCLVALNLNEFIYLD
jgi:hypothetical protein